MYVIMDHTTNVGARIAEIWSLVQEANRLDNATTRLGTLTKSMLVDNDAPHRHYPMLRCKAEEAEWLCRALAFVWPQYCNQTNPVHGHISQIWRLVLSLYDIVGTHTGLFHVPEGRELILQKCSAPDCPLQVVGHLAHDQGLKRWNTVLKHHYVGHFALQSQ